MNLLDQKFGDESYHDATPKRGMPNSLSRASRNLVPLGIGGMLRAWKGLKSVTGGARRMFPFRDGWAGLDDVGLTRASGSVFSSFFGMCVFAGNGQLSINGVEIAGAVATSVARLLLRWNGSYTAPESGAYIVGLPEPLAPQVFLTDTPSSIVPNLTGSLSFRLAGYRTTTYGRSRASAITVTITANGTAPAMVIPLAPLGLTHWAIFATKLGFAERGLLYRLTRPNVYTNEEFAETDIQRTISGLSVTVGTNIVNAPANTFKAGDIHKRLAVVSGGAVFPNPTTIIEVVSDTQVKTSNNATTGSANFAAEAIAFANGIDRCVLINYAESNLSSELAWTDDFPPPAVSHIAELEKVWVYFTGGDAKNGVDTSNGTIAQFSNKNYFESINPLWRLYLPDAVVDVLPRLLDSYLFVGTKTMIAAMQYIESYDTAPATSMVVIQGEGISAPGNWCLRLRFLYMFLTDGTVARLGTNGEIDTVFSDYVKNYLMTFIEKEKVVLQSFAEGITIFYYGLTLIYNETNNKWSTRLFLSDFAVGNAVSAVPTSSGLLVSLERDGERFAYEFDNSDTPGTFCVATTNYVTIEDKFAKTITEIFADYESDNSADIAYFGIHRNNQPQFFDDASVINDGFLGNSRIVLPNAKLLPQHVGYFLLIQGAGTGGKPFLTRIKTIINDNEAWLGTPTMNLAQSELVGCPNQVSNKYALFAYRIFQKPITSLGVQTIVNQVVELPGVYTYAVSIAFISNCAGALPLNAQLDGDIDEYFAGKILP